MRYITSLPTRRSSDLDRKLRYVGAIDDSERVQHVERWYLREALDALLAGKETPVAKTKVVGCSIKWAGKADSVRSEEHTSELQSTVHLVCRHVLKEKK